MAEWLKAADCKSARASVRWFESSPVHHRPFFLHLSASAEIHGNPWISAVYCFYSVPVWPSRSTRIRGLVWGRCGERRVLPHTCTFRNGLRKCGEENGQAHGSGGKGRFGESRHVSGWRRSFPQSWENRLCFMAGSTPAGRQATGHRDWERQTRHTGGCARKSE